MRRLLGNGFVRGVLLVAVVSAVIVALSLDASVATAGALLQIAFFLAIAFFLFLLWRERRAEIDTWSDVGKWTFYAAIVLAVVAIGLYLGIGANGPESVAFIAVIAACAFAIVRVWRRETSTLP